MRNSDLLGRVLLLLLFVAAVSAGVFGWFYIEEKRDNARLRADLADARDLKTRLGSVDDVLIRMRSDLNGVIERLPLDDPGEAVSVTASDELTATALRTWAERVDLANKSLAKELEDIKRQLDDAGKARTELSGKLNQANLDLARVNKELEGKTGEARRLDDELKKKQAESDARAAEIAQAKKDLAAANASVAALTKAKNELDDRVKTLTEAESQAKAETGKLREQLTAAETRAADLAKQVETLTAKVKELQALIEKSKPATEPPAN